MKINDAEFKLWADFIYDLCGITLNSDKKYLIESRFEQLLIDTNSQSYVDFLAKARSIGGDILKQKIVNAITTNETSFFRDSSPFNMLQYKIIPDLIDKRRKQNPYVKQLPIRIWSSACSSGQEVYSIAIILKEILGNLNEYDIRILGTDISHDMIAKASKAQYSQFEIERGFPKDKIHKYFHTRDGQLQINDEIRAMATFKPMNLLKFFSFPFKFDIIFCRNVAIYFNEIDKKRLFKDLYRVLAPDGYIIIGSTESLTGICENLVPNRYLNSVFYQPR
ncbi:MAG: protein-glutamate O-methyltransferase CheR [Candidatus Delongbacteria bacterium]|nr:protein-glutamate O-methyltransferase CheR [Candidatus Delongbacteria bacterium]MBN2833536.1 protein-glutamate O-methyltransferase CheR [Candidatus Delongbacteria bacterium]